MIGFGKLLRQGMLVAIPFVAASSCRKPVDAVKSDLNEAGYRLTAEDWFKASRNNEASTLKKFVAAGFDPDTRGANQDSALHAAASSGAKDSADFLLDRGLSVDLRGASDRTPLMCAVIGGQTHMVNWLLRQGADPLAKDREGFTPLMLAVKKGKAGAVAELAPYNRENLDAAILFAALEGQTGAIDTLTNYGASVYARMDDGRTPLMLAAQNGHADAVKLLIEIGASRLSTDAEGHTAADLATASGHPEIASIITRDPLPGELALDTPAEVARSMDHFVESTLAQPPDSSAPAPAGESGNPAARPNSAPPAVSIDGETLSAVAVPPPSPASNKITADGAETSGESSKPAALPPIVMRLYREREVPLRLEHVEQDSATFVVSGTERREVQVRAGETIPGSRLVVVRCQKRMKDSKLDPDKPAEVSIVEVRDIQSGATREWVAGVQSDAHDPVALIEDEATGRRYTATPGQRFKSADGAEFVVVEVRPNQIIIRDSASGAVSTLPLRGPRG